MIDEHLESPSNELWQDVCDAVDDMEDAQVLKEAEKVCDTKTYQHALNILRDALKEARYDSRRFG